MNTLELFEKMHNRTSVVPLLDSQIDVIQNSCASFLTQSNGCPLYKVLPQNQTFVKVKARKRTKSTTFSESFDVALDTIPNLRQRAIYAHGCAPSDPKGHTYYIFLEDGFKFVYNPTINDSNILELVYDRVNEQETFEMLLQCNYVSGDLIEGLNSGAEILIHNSPRYYAIHTSVYPEYANLLKVLNK